MNSFCVDELVLSFDELQPFSDVLQDETQLPRLLKLYKLGLFLDAVAYHYLCSASSTDPNISAWIALQALEAGAAITYSYVVENKNIELCERDDLAEFCVDSLIPSDGRIHRLHAGVFRDVISTAPTIWPAITVKRVQELFERLTPVLHKPDVLRIILWMIGHDSTFENPILTVKQQSHFFCNPESWTRYLASQFLSKNEFSYAEQLLIYANSLECKTLLIKVYDKWLNEGTPEEPKRGQLLKRIRDLETECSNSILHGRSTSTNSVASILSAGDNAASTTQSTSHKILVDACTNTPIRGDTSMLSRGDDASFFSVRSDRISATEESFESAIASPLGPNVSSKSNVSSPPRSVQPTSPLACGGADMVHVKGNTIKEEKPLVTSHSTSTNGVIVVTEKSDDGVLPEDLSHPPLTPSKSGITKSPGVIIKNSNAPMMTGSPVPIVVTKSPFGPPVINKEVAASFWKSGKSSGASLLGLFNKSGSNVQPGITPNTSTVGVPGVIGTVPPTVLLPKTQSPPVFPSSNSTIIQSKSGGNLEMTSAASTSVFGGSAQTLHIPSSSASTSGPSFLNSVSAPNLLPRQPPIMPNSLTPQEFGLNEPFSKPGIMPQMKPQYEFRNSLSSPITANGLTDNQDEDEQLVNSCKRSLKRRQKQDLLELEQQVAQYVSPADVQGAPSAVARHPGCNGVCLGCMDDDSQDRALRELTRLSEEWNADTDSETD
ncbi:hypothetical protein NECAME_10693 [Necator americanus]|uniref:Uncharacterized protein n=1 Tax=Necator americanus TaxID=51031 RepID=W2T9Q4_NECAM|nr:hypothetical protein NECAME_10693 [Necator americanus]ETN77936.1 hypothetical protein NECAME_10693 [Necator americanus]